MAMARSVSKRPRSWPRRYVCGKALRSPSLIRSLGPSSTRSTRTGVDLSPLRSSTEPSISFWSRSGRSIGEQQREPERQKAEHQQAKGRQRKQSQQTAVILTKPLPAVLKRATKARKARAKEREKERREKVVRIVMRRARRRLWHPRNLPLGVSTCMTQWSTPSMVIQPKRDKRRRRRRTRRRKKRRPTMRRIMRRRRTSKR
mmetsp:Transcript_78734/g.148556  ORF Transcript_78734/g.148556 Transcript_78734/m.148556 type:complete len:202 (+) Transcript_78734:123-728(+)